MVIYLEDFKMRLAFIWCLFYCLINTANGTCPYGWSVSGTGYCWLYIGSWTNFLWIDAANFCQQLGATLPMLKTAADQTAYTNLMTSLGVQAEIQYLGLNKVGFLPVWLWVDGSPLNYSNWDVAGGNPSGDGTCVYMIPLWNDYPCTQASHPFVCQMPEYTCPYGWLTSTTGTCYLYNPSPNMFWLDASNYCQQMGTQLPMLKTSAEQYAYNNLMISQNVSSDEIQYLGFYNSGSWLWVDNSTPTYTNWDFARGNPSGDGDCIYMEGLTYNNTWNDYSCFNPTPFSFSCQSSGTFTCPSGWLLSSCGQCYVQVVGVSYNWTTAQSHCQSIGGQLPVFHLKSQALSYNNLLAAVNVQGATYLGLTKASGSWLWVDNTTITYSNWLPGEPSGDGPCVDMWGIQGGNEFNDFDCVAAVLSPFFCQYSTPHITIITTLATTTSSVTTVLPTTTTTPATTFAAFTCPNGWLLDETENCYLYINNQTNNFLWNDALIYCKSIGASLPIFRMLAEQIGYNNLMTSINVPQTEVHFLGLYSNDAGASWLWADNSSAPFLYWGPGSPSGDGYCTYMSGLSVNNTWNDYACTWNLSPIPFCCQLSATMQIPQVLTDMNIPTDFLADPMSLTTTLQDVGPFLMSSLNNSMKQQLGQQCSDLVRICTYKTNDCSNANNFHYLYNPTYGNCYTFNYGLPAKYYVSNVGPEYGLRILLHANQEDYSCSSQNAGFRLTFHENSLPIYPEAEGYNIPPGSSSAISLSQSTMLRLGYPYEKCVPSNDIHYGANYTVEDCLRKCLQNYLIQQCQCSDPRYPSTSNVTVCQPNKSVCCVYCNFRTGNNSVVINFSENCLDHATFCLFDSAIKNCDCPPPCKEIAYYPTITSITIHTTDIYKKTFCLGSLNVSFCQDTFNGNFAILYVYYGSLKRLAYGQVATYGIMNLLSDFSGVTGLLLGVCVITIPEIVSYLFSILTICCKNKK